MNFIDFFRVHLLSDLRNRRSLFWSLIFPALLLTILVAVFSNLGTTSSIEFNVLLVNNSSPTLKGRNYAAEVVRAFLSVAKPNKNALFSLQIVKASDYQKALKEVRYSKADVVIVIPKDFNQSIMRTILLRKLGLPFSKAELEVFYLPNSASSSLALSAVEASMNEINEFVFHGQKRLKFSLKSETLGETMKAPSYVDFATPGIVIVGAFTTALFLVSPKIAFMRWNGVFKRYASTPASFSDFLAGFGLSKILLMIVQYLLIGGIGKILGSSIHMFSFWAVIYYIFTCAVYILVGFNIALFSPSITAVTALTSVLNLPLEFLAGIYFPLFNIPWYMNVLVKLDPLWYSTNAMRQLMGIGISQSSMAMNIMVPTFWGGISLFFVLQKKIWKEEKV